jgi:hypothetical protein
MLRVALLFAIAVPGFAHAQAAHHHQGEMPAHAAVAAPTEPGQGAFAAIQEIVGILEADPRTDWSKVEIAALQRHLIDMDNVTLRAKTESTPVERGITFTVSGEGAVIPSIQRMVMAHASVMNGVGGWTMTAAETNTGATLSVIVPTRDLSKLRALGFIGVMTRGMHHQQHHLMLARGGYPHN